MLGNLLTESFHPKTLGLSQLVQQDVSAAHQLLQEVDRDALESLESKLDDLWTLYLDIKDTLSQGHKVFMCGCGATGRLSLVLETLFRQKFGSTDQIYSFMAGGDFALIKSVENFEDITEYGSIQLVDLGFGPNDLLLASTEGGETPFVIGATHKARSISKRKPYFLYCNPDSVLLPIKRSREIIEDSSVIKINLTSGPMAISGSTRMQASTVLMFSIGISLLYTYAAKEEFNIFFKDFLKRLTLTDYDQFSSLTLLEAQLYKDKKYLNYVTDPDLAISILTDTTERSPTFSLKGFENRLDLDSFHAMAYLFISNTKNSEEAWLKLLRREMRPIEWENLQGKINRDHILGFDISTQGLKDRSGTLPSVEFNISLKKEIITFECLTEKMSFNWGEDSLFIHLMTKMLLNAHSTLIMGLLGRFEGNVMTWVRPSNNKLIDRAARYILQILRQKNKTPSYEEVIFNIFKEMENSNSSEPVVIRVVQKF